jgi:hypothetical protein
MTAVTVATESDGSPPLATAELNVLVAGGSVTFPGMAQAHAAVPPVAGTARALGTTAVARAYVVPLQYATAPSVQACAPQFGRVPAATTLCNPAVPPSASACAAIAPRRTANVCQTCGHLCQLGHYGTLHAAAWGARCPSAGTGTRTCPVSEADRRVPEHPLRAQKRFKTCCSCDKCADALLQQSSSGSVRKHKRQRNN